MGDRSAPAGVGSRQPPGARGAVLARHPRRRRPRHPGALVVLSAARAVPGRRRDPARSVGCGRRRRRHGRLPRPRHGRGVPARAEAGRGHGGCRRRAPVRQRPVRRVLHAALSARPAAGRDGHPGARGAAGHRALHPSVDGARVRRGVRSRDAHQADVRAVRAGAGDDGAGAGRTARARQRGPGGLGGDRDQPAVVRAPALRPAGAARSARVRAGRRGRASGAAEPGGRDVLSQDAAAAVRSRCQRALRAGPLRRRVATPVAPARRRAGPVLRPVAADPEQEPALLTAAARR